MVNNSLTKTALLPLILKHENTVFKGGICLSSLTIDELKTTCQQFLHPNEHAYFNTLLYPKRQYSYLLGRYCAKQAITAYSNFHDFTDIWIETGVFQQPIINCVRLRNTQVSISHSNTIGAAIIFPEGFPMGIDLEEICSSKLAIIETQLSLSEKKMILERSNTAIALTRFWTVKEALSKALKCGLTVPFELLEVEEMEEKDDIVISCFKNFKQYQAFSFLVNNDVCSLVYPNKTFFNINILAIQKMLRNFT